MLFIVAGNSDTSIYVLYILTGLINRVPTYQPTTSVGWQITLTSDVP